MWSWHCLYQHRGKKQRNGDRAEELPWHNMWGGGQLVGEAQTRRVSCVVTAPQGCANRRIHRWSTNITQKHSSFHTHPFRLDTVHVDVLDSNSEDPLNPFVVFRFHYLKLNQQRKGKDGGKSNPFTDLLGPFAVIGIVQYWLLYLE